MSCDQAGRIIRRDMFGKAEQIATQNTIEAGAFRCEVAALSNKGGWHLDCHAGARRLAFNFTP